MQAERSQLRSMNTQTHNTHAVMLKTALGWVGSLTTGRMRHLLLLGRIHGQQSHQPSQQENTSHLSRQKALPGWQHAPAGPARTGAMLAMHQPVSTCRSTAAARDIHACTCTCAARTTHTHGMAWSDRVSAECKAQRPRQCSCFTQECTSGQGRIHPCCVAG